ncbi:hypothetical protein WN55_09147 [Dufourea novaeangliae]|uniref:Uncharacterized protein n=1 Tax=Dufourea novaeangliae TaxID=178035 RepID=A0A154PA31_DUFNO|nr:hypothetical protein WN55_09147 [Dufourea novaeangliae]
MVVFTVLVVHGTVSTALPLDPEDLEGLLPPTPRDINETLAAVVQDPVVQDAVHQTASNGSLNGLVVKRKVYIMPANDPNKVLSTREHILVIPTENLEDVRRNITETKEAEAAAAVVETSSMNSQSFFEDEADDYMPQVEDNNSIDPIDSISPIPGQATSSSSINENPKIEINFLENAPTPETEPKKMAVPVVAVIDPSNAKNGKLNTPIVAILPNQLDGNALNNQVQFLKENSDKIQTRAQNYVDRTSIAVDPTYWRPSTSEISIVPSSTQETMQITLLPDQTDELVNEELILAPVAVPRWGYVAPYFTDPPEYTRNLADMDVAEDIIFRPLFRYRQESEERTRYRQEQNNRRYGYRYPSYNYYPRRGYYYGSRDNDY